MAGAVFCKWFLPETLNLTLEEIGHAFGDKQAAANLGEIIEEVNEHGKGGTAATHVELAPTSPDVSRSEAV